MAAVYQSHRQNILVGGTVSGATPLTGYSAQRLLLNKPAARIRYGSGTVTVTITTTSAQGDIFCLPMHNLVGAVLTLTNGNGLSVAVTPPTARVDGYPETLVVDLVAAQPNASTRTSGTWNLVISGNPSNVILGGACAVYGPRTELARNFSWGFSEGERHEGIVHRNVYGIEHRYDLLAGQKFVDVTVQATDADRPLLKNFFRGNHGHVLPGLLWLDPTNDNTSGYFGTWQEEQHIVRTFTGVNVVQMTFAELSKGVSLV